MFAQESGMDLQKEREAFEKECRLLCYKGNMVMSNLGSFYNNEQTNWMWQMWLSAKAKAVPEGFVLVPMVPSERMINAVRHCYEGEAYLPYSLYSEFVNQAIIERMEAQEPAND